MAAIDDVDIQLVDPNDPIILYEGAPKGISFSGFDMRKWLRFVAWDLLRFHPVDLFKGAYDPAAEWGLRDEITRTHYLLELVNAKVDRLAKAAGVDVADLQP